MLINPQPDFLESLGCDQPKWDVEYLRLKKWIYDKNYLPLYE